jgi:hypothetical protein
MILPDISCPVWDRLSSLSSSGLEERPQSCCLWPRLPRRRPRLPVQAIPDRHRPATSAQARPIESGTLDHPIMEGAGISLISV